MAPTAISQPSVTYYPKASNAIPVDSPGEAQSHIISFLLSRTQENLLLALSWDNLTKEIRDILQKGSEKRLCQWEYDPEYEILKVKAMGSPLHAALNSCIFRSFITAHRTTLTVDEAKCIVINPLPVLLSRPLNPGEKLGEKPAAWTKHPDNLIYFNDIEAEEQFLQIVVEIGFSESYHDLVRDASQWLLRSGGETKVVIIAKIDEDKRQRAIHHKTEQFTCTRDMLVTKYGDAMSQETFDIENTVDGIKNSSPALYKAVKSEVIASDWVGQISVYLEVWELRDGYPVLRGPRIDVLSTPANPQNLVLSVTDLIPEGCRTLFPNFDTSRTFTIDMGFFRQELNVARKLTAFHRAMEVIRPLDEDESNPEYRLWALS
ncbi:hypothetical protein BDV36DRAFT_303180 [Aspergillus pseudocaelatus]|uniref:Uncharacterized protein n=1 Tax=Aspergillus pseudocaelatus TaxID=1825620 RepID=A0ABQ6X376_9EURO|nr:hypothetical protein BDV36DRAFT_303180 [Aspergillus pseudocaelatus]